MDTIDLLTYLPEFHPLFEGLGCFGLFFFAEKDHLISPHGCKYFNNSKENEILYSFSQYGACTKSQTNKMIFLMNFTTEVRRKEGSH